jgi:hypothetical protein
VLWLRQPLNDNDHKQESPGTIYDHADAWKEILDNTTRKLFKSFGSEPLSNKTAIVCTAALIEVIQDSRPIPRQQ